MSPILRTALTALAMRLPPECIDRIWLFPPRQHGERETGLAVLALFPQDEDREGERRHLFTLRYQAERERNGLRQQEDLVELGSAPAERVERIVAGVLRRLRDAPELPEVEVLEIAGHAERWRRLLEGACDPQLDRGSG